MEALSDIVEDWFADIADDAGLSTGYKPTMAHRLVVLLLSGLWLGCAQAAPPSPAPAVVGCPADGMLGPVAAPVVSPAVPQVPAAVAEQLAYYASSGLAVLAPRGWHCVEMYGSGGASLLVTPRLYTVDAPPGFNSITGPAVELTFLNGENSGREQVSAVFSRLFPFKRVFIRNAAELEDHPRRDPDGPDRSDTTVRRRRDEVGYITPPHREGMGTFASRLGPGGNAVVGTSILSQSNGMDSVVLLNVRLPPHSQVLMPIILDAARTEEGRGDR